MRRQQSFGLPLRMNGKHKTQFDHACFDLLPRIIWSRVCFDHLSSETYSKARHWSKSVWLRLDLWSLSPALRNLWLLLVLIKNCRKLPLISFGLIQHCMEFFSLRRQMYFRSHFSPPEREIHLLHRLVLEGKEFLWGLKNLVTQGSDLTGKALMFWIGGGSS